LYTFHCKSTSKDAPEDCEGGFQCDDGKCLDNEQRCDRNPDCDNGEDEEDCNEGRLLLLSVHFDHCRLFWVCGGWTLFSW
jgi:hypothetical protein